MKICRILAIISLVVSPLANVFAIDSQRILIQNRGSDSMAIAVVEWAEQYKQNNTEIGVAVSGGGSGTGIAALINGTVKKTVSCALALQESRNWRLPPSR